MSVPTRVSMAAPPEATKTLPAMPLDTPSTILVVIIRQLTQINGQMLPIALRQEQQAPIG